MKTKILLIVDMQNDFIDGALGSRDAIAIVPNVVDKILHFEGDYIIATSDRHGLNYLNTHEGMYLPIEHCLRGTKGAAYHNDILDAFGRVRMERQVKRIYRVAKESFAYTDDYNETFPFVVHKDGKNLDIEIVGLCTDICVVSNALYLRSKYPEADIAVDAKCCAGTSPERHKAALEVMKSCQIEVLND